MCYLSTLKLKGFFYSMFPDQVANLHIQGSTVTGDIPERFQFQKHYLALKLSIGKS